MKYNTAVKARGSIPEGKKILSQTFAGNGLTVFQHDICTGIAPAFRDCDALHTEIAWSAGYKKFTQGSIAEDTTYDEYLAAVANLCRELKIPAFVLCGKQNVKRLQPDRTVPVFFDFHKTEALYAVYNYDGDFSPKDEYGARDFVARNFTNVLDPCCGYGILAESLLRHGKKGVLSDINTTCLEYVNTHFILGDAPARKDFQIVDTIEMRKISEIRPYFRNPRKNEKTVEMLIDLIPRVGFNVPILIDEAGVIVKGHARYRAAIRLGLEKVPCVVTYADEEAKKLDRLADNKVSELSEWVNDDLLHELDMLTTDFDLSKLGFPTVDLDDFLPDLAPDDEDGNAESEEEKRRRYQAFLDSQPGEPPKELITTQASIDRAAEKQQNVPEKPKKYFRIVCEHCGHVMFVAEGDAMPVMD